MEYKVYKNGNMHVKFNKEFTKAMNVEVSRILGWIKTKEDIAKEFYEMCDCKVNENINGNKKSRKNRRCKTSI